MSRRSRLHYTLTTIGYRASRMKARLPRSTCLLGDSLSFGAAVRYELPSHTASRRTSDSDLDLAVSSCNCFSLMVASDRLHKGLSPSITQPCPTHIPRRRERDRRSPRSTGQLMGSRRTRETCGQGSGGVGDPRRTVLPPALAGGLRLTVGPEPAECCRSRHVPPAKAQWSQSCGQ